MYCFKCIFYCCFIITTYFRVYHSAFYYNNHYFCVIFEHAFHSVYPCTQQNSVLTMVTLLYSKLFILLYTFPNIIPAYLQFNTESSCAIASDTSWINSIGTGPFTISFWFSGIYPSHYLTPTALLSTRSKNDYGAIFVGMMGTWRMKGAGSHWNISTLYSGYRPYLQTSSNFIRYNATTLYTDGNWQHFVITRSINKDRTEVTLTYYINATIIYSHTYNTVANVSKTAGTKLYIGCDPWSTGFVGKLSELSIWNRTLTEHEVYNMYRTPSLLLDKMLDGDFISNDITFHELLHYYPLNESPKDCINDDIVYDVWSGNNAKLTTTTEVVCVSANGNDSPDLSIIILSIIISIIAIIIFVIIVMIKCMNNRRNKRKTITIKNPMVIVIGIGNYNVDNIDINNMDERLQDITFSDLDVHVDLQRLIELFGHLKYAVFPDYNYNYNAVTIDQTGDSPRNEEMLTVGLNYKSHTKLKWTENELIDFLKDKAKDLEDNIKLNHESSYDGLIVIISCHGLKNHIITSDYQMIEKLAIHRIFSINHKLNRTIPRIFIYDCCDGMDRRDRSPSPYTITQQPPFEDDHDEYGKCAMGKGYGLSDISSNSGSSWTRNEHNPDFRLCTIYAANAGFMSMMNAKDGSYLIKTLSEKLIMGHDNKFLGEICEEIEKELYEEEEKEKQLIDCRFHNQTQYIKFNKSAMV